MKSEIFQVFHLMNKCVTSLNRSLISKSFRQLCLLGGKSLQIFILAYVILVHIAAYCSWPLIFVSLWLHPSYSAVLLIYLCWFWVTSTINFRTSKINSWDRLNVAKNCYRQYFPVQIIKTADLPANRNYLLVVYPHSFQAHSVIINFLLKSPVVNDLFPAIDFRVLALKIYFYLPILREHLLFMGACPATEDFLISLFQSKPSKAAVLLAGGAREVSLQRPGDTYTIISHRKGFVRIALKTGTSLIPSFSFGENRVFDSYNLEWPWLTKFVDAFHRITGLRITLPRGRGFFQNKFGFLPRRNPIYTVVGKPIAVPKVENPSNTTIDKYHKIFFQALRQLFDEHKQFFDPAGCDAQLRMVS